MSREVPSIVFLHDRTHGNFERALRTAGIVGPYSLLSYTYTDPEQNPYNDGLWEAVDSADHFIVQDEGVNALEVAATLGLSDREKPTLLVVNDSYQDVSVSEAIK